MKIWDSLGEPTKQPAQEQVVNIQHQDENNQNVHYEDQYRAGCEKINISRKSKIEMASQGIIAIEPVVRLNTPDHSLGTDCR